MALLSLRSVAKMLQEDYVILSAKTDLNIGKTRRGLFATLITTSNHISLFVSRFFARQLYTCIASTPAFARSNLFDLFLSSDYQKHLTERTLRRSKREFEKKVLRADDGLYDGVQKKK